MLERLVIEIDGDLAGLKRTGTEAGRILQGIGGHAEGLEAPLRRSESRFARFGASIRGALTSPLAQLASVGALAVAFDRVTDAADAHDASQRKLAATAKITGQNLGFLQKTALDAKNAFGFSTATAAEFTTEISKLTAKAGEIDQTGAAIGAFLDLGAARGMDAAETLQAVRMAILGVDEGTDRLFGKNPSVLYEEFARAAGKPVSSLTDSGKALAILTAAMEDGGKVAGEYGKWLETPAGQAYILGVRNEETAAKIGRAMNSVRSAALPVLQSLSEKIAGFVEWLQVTGATLPVFFGQVRVELAKLNEGTGGVLGSLASKLEGINNAIDEQIAKLPGGLRQGLQGLRSLDPFGFAIRGAATLDDTSVAAAQADLERLRDSSAAVIAEIRREMSLMMDVAGDTNPLQAMIEAFGEDEAAAKKLKKQLEELDETLRAGVATGTAGSSVIGQYLTPELRAADEEARLLREDFEALGGTLEKVPEFSKRAAEGMSELEEGLRGVAMSLTDQLAASLVEGELRIKEFVTSALRELARLAARLAAMKLLQIAFAAPTGGASIGAGAISTGMSLSRAPIPSPTFGAGMAGGGIDSAALVSALQSRPRPLTPREAAQDEWWATFVGEALRTATGWGWRPEGA